jgi:hypothetical protein
MLFFPIYNIFYWLLGQEKISDLGIVWNAVSSLSNPFEMICGSVITIFLSAFLLLIAGLYFNAIKKSDLAI